MNCKEGDLAVVVSPGSSPALGMIVKCVRPLPLGSIRVFDGLRFKATTPTWELDREIPTIHTPTGKLVMVNYRADNTLRPLVWDAGEDEMVSLVKRKKGVSA